MSGTVAVRVVLLLAVVDVLTALDDRKVSTRRGQRTNVVELDFPKAMSELESEKQLSPSSMSR